MLPLLLLAAVASDANADNVVRCVREDVTGSLSSIRKVCHTVGEWRRIRRDANDEARRTTQPGNLNRLNDDPGTPGSVYVPG